MTPEELDKLEALVKAATAGGWYVDSSRRGIETQTDVGPVEVIAWAYHHDVVAIAALHNAAPALIVAARDLHALQLGIGHPMWLPSVADALSMDDPFAATSGDVLDRVRALAREVERLRAFVPVWRRLGTALYLYVGGAIIGEIDSKGYGWARGGVGSVVCYSPSPGGPAFAEAAAAVCARLGISGVEVPS